MGHRPTRAEHLGETMSDITTALDAYCGAVAALDAEATLACYADDARVFDGMAPWEYADKAAWAKGVHAWLDPLTGAGECRIDRRRITEVGDLAIVDGFAFYAADHTEEGAETTTRFTQVWRRDGDRWLIVHEHTSWPVDDSMKPSFAPA